MINPNSSGVADSAQSGPRKGDTAARLAWVDHRQGAAVDTTSACGDPRLALSFSEVTKRFPNGTLALDRVSWSIAIGARACLLGPNGAGKSTAIRLLEGALRPTSGQVSLLGAKVGGSDYLAARRRTGIVPQGPGMYPDLTVAEYLDLARRLYGRGDPARVVEVLDLGPHRDTMLAQLSGGYQRRVVLAAALLAAPDLLLLDEPTAGLDPLAAHDVHAFLQETMRGRTTLLCTHNLAEAEALCDEIVILRSGKILVHAPLATLRERFHPRVRLAARQGTGPVLEALQHRDLVGHIDPDDLSNVIVPIDDVSAEIPDLLRGLLADGLDVYCCAPLQVTLETLFLDSVRSAP